MHQDFAIYEDDIPPLYEPRRAHLCAHGRAKMDVVKDHIVEVDLFLVFINSFVRGLSRSAQRYFENATVAMRELKRETGVL